MRTLHRVFAAVVAAFALFEFFSRRWPRHRRAAVGSAVFVFNAGIVLGLTGMCLAALLVAPALGQAR